MILAPSLLASDFSNVEKTLNELEERNISWLHLDVMDGSFVQTITFGPQLVAQSRPHSTMVFDCHLMVVNPENHIEAFANAGADVITFHFEATDDPKMVIDLIHEHGKRAGISVKPGTDVSVLDPYLDYVDLVLVMSVEPGKGGQSFMPNALDKISYLKDKGGKFEIQVDGGVNLETGKMCLEAGATNLVAGSFIFKDFDNIERMNALDL